MNNPLAQFEMPIRDPCPFCELAAGRGETRHIINTTEKTLTVINHRQLLVIPRRHAPTILNLRNDEAVEIMNKTRTAAETLIETFNPDGITVYQ